MRDHVIGPRYQNTDNDQVRRRNNSKWHDSVTTFWFDEDETGEPNGPGDRKPDRSAEETLSFAIITRQLEDEEAHHEQDDQQKYIVAWNRFLLVGFYVITPGALQETL